MKNKMEMKKVERWREKKIREKKVRRNKVGVEKCVTFSKKGNDSISMKRTKMTTCLYYYRTEGI